LILIPVEVVGDCHYEHARVGVKRFLHSGARAEAEVGEAGDAWCHAASGQERLLRFFLPARAG